MNLIKNAFQAIKDGELIVIPTDTLPGISFDPKNKIAFEKIKKLKERESEKPFINLVYSFEQALQIWGELNGVQTNLIKKVWPGPVSIIYKNIALRFPKLELNKVWVYSVIKKLDTPLPSTSVNYSGERPLISFKEVSSFCEKNNLKSFLQKENVHSESSSAIIELLSEGSYNILREGTQFKKL